MRLIILVLLCIIMAGCSRQMQSATLSGQTDHHFLQGNQFYYQENRYKKALKAYKRVPSASPNYATAQRYIGHNIYGREWNQWEKGLPYLEEAYRVAPGNPKVMEDIGRAYLKVGKTEEGVKLLKTANTNSARRALAELER